VNQKHFLKDNARSTPADWYWTVYRALGVRRGESVRDAARRDPKSYVSLVILSSGSSPEEQWAAFREAARLALGEQLSETDSTC
jgi:hypothetical protein